jgi:hypothetical protein
MKSREFVYWLQGAFEIGKISEFSDEQFKVIAEKLEQLEDIGQFTFVARTLFRNYNKEEIFDVIYQELQEVFIHDIDQSYEGDQQFLCDVHEGKITNVQQ